VNKYSFFKVYDSIIELIISIIFLIMVVLLFAEVVSRYLFSFPIMWSEEIGRYLFVWLVYLASAQVFKERGERRHLSVDVLSSKLNSPYNIYLELIIYIIVLVFLFFIFLYGLKYVSINWCKSTYSLRLFKLGWFYLSIPMGAIFMIVSIIRIIPDILKSSSKKIKKTR